MQNYINLYKNFPKYLSILLICRFSKEELPKIVINFVVYVDYIGSIAHFDIIIKNAFHCKITLNVLGGGDRRKREIQSGKRKRERERREECHVQNIL